MQSFCFCFSVSCSPQEAVKVWNFLSLLCLPVARLPGEGPAVPPVCPSLRAGSPLPPTLRSLLTPFFLPVPFADLLWGPAPGAPVCLRLLTLWSLLTPTAPDRLFWGPVHTWVFTGRRGAAGHRPRRLQHTEPGSVAFPVGWGSQQGGESWTDRMGRVRNWPRCEQPAVNGPRRVPRVGVWTDFGMRAHGKNLRHHGKGLQ